MKKISNIAMLLLVGSTIAALGCAEMPPDDPDGDGFGDRDDVDEEDVDEATDPVLAGQTLIQASSELCWNAYSASVLNMVKCNTASARQSWIIDTNTWLIRSTYYWGRCAEIPKSLTDKVTLQPCDEWDSYQWFPFVPPTNSHDLICGWVKDGAGINRCLSHKGTSYVYTTTPNASPDWYRMDF